MTISDFINTYPTQIIITMMIIIIVLIIVLILNVKSQEGFKASATYTEVEFRSADNPSICVHKLGATNDFDCEVILHWWKELGHENAKNIVIYDTDEKIFTVSRKNGGKTYRWNIQGPPSCSCAKAHIQYHDTLNKIEPEPNESFKFNWINNDTFEIKTKNNGNVGGELGHDKDIFAGSSVKALKFKLYSYVMKRFLNKSDFGESNVGTTTRTDTQSIARFNLMYHSKYLVPERNGNVVRLAWTNERPSQEQFALMPDKSAVFMPTLNAMILRPIKTYDLYPTKRTGNVTFDEELVGEARYCRGCTKKLSEDHMHYIYLKPGDMPKYTCCKRDHRNYIPIKSLQIVDYFEQKAR